MGSTTLQQFCNSNLYDTDKYYLNNVRYTAPPQLHSYVENFYGSLLDPHQNTITNVLEIGVWTGGSHLLWRDYFPNAMVYGLDICDYPYRDIEDRIVFMKRDAYLSSTVNMFPDNYFDLIIDDGPHTLESLKFFAEHYSKKLVAGGILVMEDILDINWCNELIALLPEYMQDSAKIYDLREQTNCYADVAIVVS